MKIDPSNCKFCSIYNKNAELDTFLSSNDINILLGSKSHLDNRVFDKELGSGPNWPIFRHFLLDQDISLGQSLHISMKWSQHWSYHWENWSKKHEVCGPFCVHIGPMERHMALSNTLLDNSILNSEIFPDSYNVYRKKYTWWWCVYHTVYQPQKLP